MSYCQIRTKLSSLSKESQSHHFVCIPNNLNNISDHLNNVSSSQARTSTKQATTRRRRLQVDQEDWKIRLDREDLVLGDKLEDLGLFLLGLHLVIGERSWLLSSPSSFILVLIIVIVANFIIAMLISTHSWQYFFPGTVGRTRATVRLSTTVTTTIGWSSDD